MRKKQRMEYRIRLRVSRKRLMEVLEKEGFFFRKNKKRPTKLEIQKRLKNGRIHGSIEFLPFKENTVIIRMHEDRSYWNILAQRHFVIYPSSEIEGIIEKLKQI